VKGKVKAEKIALSSPTSPCGGGLRDGNEVTPEQKLENYLIGPSKIYLNTYQHLHKHIGPLEVCSLKKAAN
jgi:hypothetical protein